MTNEYPFGVLNADGTLQIDSNDRELRIVLTRICVINEGKKVDTFRSACYVKDGHEWQKVTNSEIFSSVDAFLGVIKDVNEFEFAVHDIERQRLSNVRCDHPVR